MKIPQKVAMMFLTATLSFAHAQQYTIQYKGVTLGIIDDISTVNQLYLKAKVTNFIAKLLLKHKYFVFYDGNKPHISDAKFRKDKNNVLFALNEAITVRPNYKIYPSPKGKKLIIQCHANECNYIFYKREKVTGKGKILFDEHNRFYELVEEKSDVVIRRK